MNTKNHIASLLENFQALNIYSFSFSYTEDSYSVNFELTFDIPEQTALMYSLLHSMLIRSTIISLVDSKTIKILILPDNAS